ncbi:MAG: hypothetical protein ACE37F_13100 [Nannocystaceae bacterium]|nr:hypothetical protein [bacterium]
MPQEFLAFSSIRVGDVLGRFSSKFRESVEQLPRQTLQSSNEHELAQEVASRHELVVPFIDFDDVGVDSGMRQVLGEHMGAIYAAQHGKLYEKETVIFRLSYRGKQEFFRCYDSTQSLNPARIFFDDGKLCFEVLSLSMNKEEIVGQRDRTLAFLRQFLSPVAYAVESWNDGLERRALQQIQARKKDLESRDEFLAGLGTPVQKSRPPEAVTITPPVRRKKIHVERRSTTKVRPADPTLDDKTYQDILECLASYARTMEQHVATYLAMGEDDIRANLLGLLKASFDGSASGETFNRIGKTDILLQHEGNNLFVAECKFWGGEKHYHATLDQLLGYLTWRDSKAATLLFVRNKSIENVLDEIRAKTSGHPAFREDLGESDGMFHFRFELPHAAGSFVRVAVMTFHLA